MASRLASNSELLEAALRGYLLQRDRIEAHIAQIQKTIGGSAGSPRKGGVKRKHRISAAGLERIRAGQRKRWAAAKESR